MSVMRPELIMRSVIPVVMAGIIGIYGLVVAAVITNNITEEPVNASSFQIGLSNIRERYRILADKEVEVVSGDSFTVKLPIL